MNPMIFNVDGKFGSPYLGSCKLELENRPSSSDNKWNLNRENSKLNRPSTSKLNQKDRRFERTKTGILSQEEYKILQNAAKINEKFEVTLIKLIMITKHQTELLIAYNNSHLFISLNFFYE